jgi:hypothetical protein
MTPSQQLRALQTCVATLRQLVTEVPSQSAAHGCLAVALDRATTAFFTLDRESGAQTSSVEVRS